ncbi:MAG TPA: lysophospholipid acyltransferase family protein [Candidatus Omnitrophota bacterium]|nr:lysophospholipid acyltransferase family protein [Candidatus Omnitrophota bacterium]HPS36276.1 lysophospholipid acyltransferase family protein [Candidatus Omnitrophota bacterium]
MNHFFQYMAVLLLTLLAKALPVEISTWIARRVGDLSYLILAKRRKIALENVTRAFGDSMPLARKKQIVHSAFESASLSMMELFIVEKIKKDVEKRITLHGNEFMEKAFSGNKGVVLVISHLGSWEYLSFLPYFTKRPWAVVVKDIKNPYLDKAIDAMRRIMTVVPIPKNSSIRTILKELKSGHGVAILIDQWAGDQGIWSDFFNIGTSTTSIPARLAEKTGCALVPAYCLRKSSGRYEIHIDPALPVNTCEAGWESLITKQLNEVLENQIRKYPEQWLWGHRRWKDRSISRTAE